jgi:hypothetical protein
MLKQTVLKQTIKRSGGVSSERIRTGSDVIVYLAAAGCRWPGKTRKPDLSGEHGKYKASSLDKGNDGSVVVLG